MGCTSTLSGCVLVVVNIVFFLIGLAFSVCGGILKWAPNLYTNSIREFVTKIPGDDNVSIKSDDITEVLDQLVNFLGPIAIALFIIGLVFAFISLLAMCGVCCKSRCIIGIYAVITGIIAVAVTAFTIVLFVRHDLVMNLGETKLKEFVEEKYEGITEVTSKPLTFNGISGFLDLFQLGYQCCGINNYTDFYNAKNWKRSLTLTKDGSSQIFNLTIPISCCNITPAKVNITMLDSCIKDPDENNSFIATACYTKLWNEVQKNLKYVQYGFVGCSAFLVLLVIIAICATRFDDEKVKPM